MKVRGYGSTQHMRAMADAYADMPQEQRDNPDIRYEIEGDCMAKTLILDWAGIDDLKFSPENAKKVVSDPDLRIFRAGIDWATKTVAQNGRANLEADAKN